MVASVKLIQLQYFNATKGDIILKQAIILASFGAVNQVIRESTINALFADIKLAFPNFDTRQAYTSNFTRNKLKSQGLEILSIEDQITSLKAEGFVKIIILPSHLTPGEEFDYKIKPFESDDVKILSPLFTLDGSTDFDKLAFDTILNCFKIVDDEELVLIGHGSPHRHNPVYENLQKLADLQNLKVHIGVIEPTDTPNFDDVIKRLQKNRANNILLAPLLFNGGVHVNEDIAGNNNSWKIRIIEVGFKVRICTEGLGSFESFRELYIEKLSKAVDIYGN